METYYVVQVIKDGQNKVAIDYPKDFPLPNAGDRLLIKAPDGWEYSGVVTKKRFTVRDYRELIMILECD